MSSERSEGESVYRSAVSCRDDGGHYVVRGGQFGTPDGARQDLEARLSDIAADDLGSVVLDSWIERATWVPMEVDA